MSFDYQPVRKLIAQDLTEVLIRGGLIAFMVIVCFRIFSPFTGLLTWALILAVALYPLHQKMSEMLGGKQGRASVFIVLIGLLIIGVPTVALGTSFTSHIYSFFTAVENNTLVLSGPSASVADWPIIGTRLYEMWSDAAQSLPEFLESVRPQIIGISKFVFSLTQKTAGGMLVFCASLVLSGVMMAYGASGSEAIVKVLKRLAGDEKGVQIQVLATKTVRSIASGVIGVSFIQALILGVGFSLAGMPAAGVFTFLALILGIAQIPAAIVTLPAIAYLWGVADGGTVANILFTIYFVLGGLVDNVLKPLLLGRGVDAPMPIVLIGALGGMISGGFVGLFVGGVALSVGYVLFMQWVASEPKRVEDGA